MLDSDLARLYQTETRTLNQTVRRNAKRFPEDFMFQLHRDEFELLMSQIVISKKESRGGRQKLPLVFTELGVGMLSCILGNDNAIQISIAALRAFAQAKQISEDQNGLAEKVDFLKRELQELKHSHERFENKFDSYLSTNTKVTERRAKADAVNSVPALTQPIVYPKRSEEGVRSAFPRKRGDSKVEMIQSAVSQYYQVSIPDLKSEARSALLSLARQVCIYLIRELTGLSYQKIGFHFGGRDHSTVLHACGRIRCLLGTDIETRDALSEIQSWLEETMLSPRSS